MRAKNSKRAVSILAALFFSAALLCPALSGIDFAASNKVYAAENDFDSTGVLADLTSSETFNIGSYPYSYSGNMQLLSFVEYCYAYNAAELGNYGLYVYIYNPQQTNINTDGKNKIQLAVAYNEDGVATDWEKFDLKFLSKSSGNYNNRFYKFRIVDKKSADGKTIRDRVNRNQRRYDISGLELITSGSQNAIEHTIGSTYRFTGFSKGYGEDASAESSLNCEATELETIELELNSTFFRTETSSAGAGHQNQLNSVYFAVDNSYFERYGNIQKIKAEWYEYKTDDILVLGNSNIYNTLLPYKGVEIGTFTSALKYSFYHNMNQISLAMPAIYEYDWTYNTKLSSSIANIYRSKQINTRLKYLFLQSDLQEPISSERLAQYIYNYNSSYAGSNLNIHGRTISADLFLNTVDSGRTRGYNLVEIDAGDTYDLLSYNKSHKFFDVVSDYSWWAAITGKYPQGTDYYGVEPIHWVENIAEDSTPAMLAEELLIDEGDVDEFKAFYDNAKSNNQRTMLFRFAATDYHSWQITYFDNDAFITTPKNDAYGARQTVFLDFDIIQLTFNKEGNYHVIPVVSSPIDIVPPVTPPVDLEDTGCNKNNLINFIIAVVIVLVIIFLLPVAWGWIKRLIGKEE